MRRGLLDDYTMELSGRKKRQLLHEQAVREADRILDVFRCVERLAGLTPSDLRRLAVRGSDRGDGRAAAADRGPTTLRLARDVARGDGPLRVDVADLVRALPRHVVACLLSDAPPRRSRSDAAADAARSAWIADVTRAADVTATGAADHAARCMRLLCNLVSAADNGAAVFAPAADAARGDASVRGATADAAALCLLAVAGPLGASALTAATAGDGDAAVGVAALASAALDALWAVAPRKPAAAAAAAAAPGGPSARARDAAASILASARAPLILPAAADAVRVAARCAAAALAARGDAGYDAARLAAVAADGLASIGDLLAVPAFYAGLARRDPSLAGPLRLARDALALAPASTGASPAAATAAAVAAARGVALFVALSEHAAPPFLDVAFDSPDARPIAVAVADAALAAAAAAIVAATPVVSGGGDGDTNNETNDDFGVGATPPASGGDGFLALASLSAAELLSDDSNYRAEATAALAPALAVALLAPPAAFRAAWCGGRAARCIALFKILGNLHVFDPATCEPEADGRAARALLAAGLTHYAAAATAGTADPDLAPHPPAAAVAARAAANLRALKAEAAALRDAAAAAPPHAPDALVAPTELKLVDGLAAAMRAAATAADAGKGEAALVDAVAAVRAARGG